MLPGRMHFQRAGTPPQAINAKRTSNPTMTDTSGTPTRDEAGRFLPGNRLWEARSTAGPKPKFDNPDSLWSACVEYFEWCHNNPLLADNLVTFQGTTKHEPIAKMRAMTIVGLCIFLDIDAKSWRGWRSPDSSMFRSDLLPIITRVEQIIYEQKFTGAAADMLNPNIIARDLGLADKKELSGPDGEALVPTRIELVAPEHDDGEA